MRTIIGVYANAHDAHQVMATLRAHPLKLKDVWIIARARDLHTSSTEEVSTSDGALWGGGPAGADARNVMAPPPSDPGTPSDVVAVALQHEAPQEAHGDPHLRSTRAVTGYRIHALDGAIGHIADFIVDAETWAIQYLVVDTRNWWPGTHVLVGPRWFSAISWEEHTIYVDLHKEQIKRGPVYHPEQVLHRADVEQQDRYYGRRPASWEPAARPTDPSTLADNEVGAKKVDR